MRHKVINILVPTLITTILIMTSLLGFVGCGADSQDGTGTQDGDIEYAARLDTLEGKTICELSNDEWQAFRILPEIRRQLEALYPTAEFVPYTEFPMSLVSMGKQETADELAQRGCQCVIIANIG